MMVFQKMQHGELIMLLKNNRLKMHILILALCSPFVSATDLAYMGDKGQSLSNNGEIVINDKTKYSNQQQQQQQLNRNNQQLKLNISDKHINRIITPFKNPSLKMDSIENVSYKLMDNVIYLSTSNKQPIGLFITEKGDELTSVKMLLIPKVMPPQEIVLDELTNVFSSVSAKQFERSQPHVDKIKNILTELAKNNIPMGYSMGVANGYYMPTCNQLGLTFNFHDGQHFDGGDYVVSVAIIKNESPINIEIKETNCIDKRIVGIAAYPRVLLKPNEKTELFVMMRKQQVETIQKRQSLVN